MCYILPNIYDTKKGTAWQALFRDFLCKFSRFFRAFCPFLLHSFTDCQIMKLPASVRPPAALIRASLPLFSVLWYSFLPMVVPSSPDARSRHISNGNPRRPAGSPLMAAARVRLFEFYNISNLVYHFLSPLLLPYTPTASPSTFPMLSLITRSA